jgi:hypothetical protein
MNYSSSKSIGSPPAGLVLARVDPSGDILHHHFAKSFVRNGVCPFQRSLWIFSYKPVSQSIDREIFVASAPPQTRPDRRPDKKSLNKQIPINCFFNLYRTGTGHLLPLPDILFHQTRKLSCLVRLQFGFSVLIAFQVGIPKQGAEF